MSQETTYRVGVDAGGTFTDFFLEGSDGTQLLHKVSSTPDDPARAVGDGLKALARMTGLSPSAFLGAVQHIVHGTTVATNAVLTRGGALTAAIVTRGFRDTLALRDGRRQSPYDNRVSPVVPLLPRRRVIPVTGRLDHAGNELDPLDLEDVVSTARHLSEGQGVEVVVVCLLHATANPSHERAAAEAIRTHLPDVHVVVASDLLPVVGYFDRLSTAVLNAYVTPVMARYIRSLTQLLTDSGFGGTLVLMQSNGGVASVDEVLSRPVNSILSGPASAPTAGGTAARHLRVSDATVVDMGGTSFDATVLHEGKAALVSDGWIDGHRLALPMLDIHTVGAGGGSIAQLASGGLLRVGPESAGAVPGPACYGRGGNRATVTDADVVLGFINPETFLDGRAPLDAPAARRVIQDQIADPLGLSVERAAGGIFRMINVSMASAVRAITLRRGIDPRAFPLVVAGGAGPIHAAAIAWEMEIPIVVIPRHSSVFCAAGMLGANFRHDYVMSLRGQLADLRAKDLSELWVEMRERGLQRLESEGLARDSAEVRPAIDLRYVGQWSELRVDVAEAELENPNLGTLALAFHDRHNDRFGYSSPSSPIESITVRLTVIGRIDRPVHAPSRRRGHDSIRPCGSRMAWSPGEQAMAEHAVYDGIEMSPGVSVAGPSLIELGVTTILVPREYVARVDPGGAFILNLHAESARVAELLEYSLPSVHASAMMH